MSRNLILCIILASTGLLFLLFSVLFSVRKEKACGLIAGFNALTEKQQAQYDRAAIARDYARLFAAWTVGAFLFAVLCLFFGWVPFCIAFSLLIASTASHMHLWAENAFAKYKIDQ